MKFYNLKLQIRTCPDFYLSIENFESGHVRISITDTSGFQFFELLNFKSGHVRISNPDTSGFQFSNCKISNPDVSGIQFRTCPDFNYGLQILSSTLHTRKEDVQEGRAEATAAPASGKKITENIEYRIWSP